MKKRFSIIIALALVLSIALPVLASCVTNKTVKTIEVVDAKTTYAVDDVIDYDGLKIKVTYDDNSTETKTVKELSASVTKADLSKAGNSSYTVSYKGQNVTINIKVEAKQVIPPVETKAQIQTFVEPEFYTNYKSKSANREQGATEERADFRLTGETYEVGNANKFVFRPTGTALDIDKGETVDIDNVKTTAKVYAKDAKDGTYAEVEADALADLVAIEDNAYKFTAQSAGKYVKLEISVDAEEYDIDELQESERTITVEFVVVDGGYNAYDQLGLSVMSDMEKCAWADLWGAKAEWNEESQAYVLSAKDGVEPVQLSADDEPLYTYVGNVKSVILHTSLILNADQMPAMYFWNGQETEYNTAYTSIAGLPDLQDKLIGSLRDGENNNNYYRYNDVKNIDGYDGYCPITKIGLNMQKGLFATCKVNVSGNYNSIIVPETASESGRTFITVVDWGNDGESKADNPVTHVSVFQVHMVETEEGREVQYTIKNLAMSGNSPKADLGSDVIAKGVPAGMMMLNCYTKHLMLNNIVADKFFTNIVVDGYGPTGVDFANAKMYDAYSNMFYMWRSTVNVVNSELVGAGGPLFILCDGDNHFMGDNHTDAEGSNITVDTASKLESYATGTESWYAINNATGLVGMLKGQIEKGAINNMGKTIVTKKDSQNDYVNVIAAIICSPSDLLAGNSSNLIDVCGSYTTKEGEKVVEQFAMHNNVLVATRENSRTTNEAGNYDAQYFPVIFQLGNLMTHTDLQSLYAWDGNGPHAYGLEDRVAWAGDTHSKLAIYMSAAKLSQSSMAPFFGVIVDVDNLPQAGN